MSTASSEEPDEPPLLTREFALLLAVQLAFGFAFSSFFLLPKFVVTELGGTPSQVGYVGALAVVAAVLVSPLCGKLLDRGPRRRLILLGAALSTLSSLGFLFVGQLGPYLYAVRAVQGISFTLFFVAATTLAADLAPPARLGQALGWFGSAALVMNATATMSAERIAHAWGWHAVFGSAAGAGLLCCVLALQLREPGRDAARAQVTPAVPAPPPNDLRTRVAVLWAAAAGGAAFGVMFTFAPPFALELGESQVSPLFAGYTVAALLVRLAFGNLADRWGRARVAAAALTFYALVVASTAALGHGWLGVVGLGFGLAHGAFYPSLNALALEGIAHGKRGSIAAHFGAAFNSGMLLVTFCFGQIAQAYGYRVIFLLVACLTASGCPLLWSQMRRKSWLPRPLSE